MEWRCFHCDEVFADRRCAQAHFGPDETSTPACRIKAGAEGSLLTALRRSEADCNEMMQRIQSETTDAATAYYAQMARHQEQLRIAEELGFERGIAELATADAAGFARGVEAMKAGALADEPIDEAITVWFGAIGWPATINEESRAYYIARMKAFVGAAVETAARALLPRVTP